MNIYKPLPKDILVFINENFSTAKVDYIVSLCSVYYANRSDNNYYENVIRASLYLSKGDMALLEENLSHGDYRDILLAGEIESGNFGHYFNISFPEIDNLIRQLEQDGIKRINEFDNLPIDFYLN